MDTIVVTPSVRAFDPEYFRPIIDADIPHIIIDDSKGQADRSGLKEMPNAIYADEKFKYRYLGSSTSLRILIPSGNPSCKNFGLYYAWQEGFQRVILLDDDCKVGETFLDDVPVGKQVIASRVSSNSGWYNTLQQLGRTDLYARGYPYHFRTSVQDYYDEVSVESSFNEGLWYRTPDINGVDKLAKIRNGQDGDWYLDEQTTYVYPEYALMTRAQKLPLSIMNVQLDAALIPAFWQPPDYNVYDNFRIRRHDDIWSMMFLKTLMNIVGDLVTVGKPMISHMKAGDTYNEILSEHCTNLIQPYLEKVIEESASSVVLKNERTYAGMAVNLAKTMRNNIVRTFVPGYFAQILDLYTIAAEKWAELFL